MKFPRHQAASKMPRFEAVDSLKTKNMALSRVSLRNFKGHERLDLDMGRITSLIGPTGSGKSTALQALNLLKSTLEDGNATMLNGSSEGYGRFADIVTGGNMDLEVVIGVEGSKAVLAGGVTVDTKFSYRAAFSGGLSTSSLEATVDMDFGTDAQGAACSARLAHTYGGDVRDTVVSGALVPGGSPTQARGEWGPTPGIEAKLAKRPEAGAFREMFGSGAYFESLLDFLWYVPFSRVATSHRLPLEYSESILSSDRARAEASLISNISTDNAIQEKISEMIGEIRSRRIATRNIPVASGKNGMITLEFSGGKSRNTIVHEGSGLNQLVSMLAVLAGAPAGSVVTIEEPELHLDPASQARLMGIIARQATEEGKQIVFTTHSDHLLYPLLAYVEKKGYPLANGDVAIHYFDTDESGEMAGAERLAINERGQVQGGLKGFWDADMKAMDGILG